MSSVLVVFVVLVVLVGLGLEAAGEDWRRGTCVQPAISPFGAGVSAHYHSSPPARCPGPRPPLTLTNSSTLTVSHGYSCVFREVLRRSEAEWSLGRETRVPSHHEYTLRRSDFVSARCEGRRRRRYQGLVVGMRPVPDPATGWQLTSHQGLQVNVLILGFESMARPALIRVLPKSHAFLVHRLRGVLLQGYNVVGDGTVANLTPLLTGDHLHRHFTKPYLNKSANSMPFIWKDYYRHGYVTVHAEDMPRWGTFNIYQQGFRRPPTHHYMRHLYQALGSPATTSGPGLYCNGSHPRHQFMLDYVKLAFTTYPHKPKLVFAFHGELSHDHLRALGAADQDLRDTLAFLHRDGHLNHTFLFLLGDHGHRFGSTRREKLGRDLHKMPYLAVVPPPWFPLRHPRLWTNLQVNAGRLTTPFDVHATLLHLLNLKDGRRGRAQSLLLPVPVERSCGQARVPTQFCGCQAWERLDPRSPVVLKAASRLVHTLNTRLAGKTRLCRRLWLKRVRSAERHGDTYLVQVVTTPGLALLEATFQYWPANNSLSLSLDALTRVNRYGSQSHCVLGRHPELRPFCYCKHQLPNP